MNLILLPEIIIEKKKEVGVPTSFFLIQFYISIFGVICVLKHPHDRGQITEFQSVIAFYRNMQTKSRDTFALIIGIKIRLGKSPSTLSPEELSGMPVVTTPILIIFRMTVAKSFRLTF